MTYKSIDFGTIQLVQSSIQKTAQNHWTPSWTHIRLPLARPKSQAFILRASPTSSASCCFRCPATWEVRRDDHFSWDDGSPFFCGRIPTQHIATSGVVSFQSTELLPGIKKEDFETSLQCRFGFGELCKRVVFMLVLQEKWWFRVSQLGHPAVINPSNGKYIIFQWFSDENLHLFMIEFRVARFHYQRMSTLDAGKVWKSGNCCSRILCFESSKSASFWACSFTSTLGHAHILASQGFHWSTSQRNPVVEEDKNSIWLVVGPPLWKILVNWDD